MLPLHRARRPATTTKRWVDFDRGLSCRSLAVPVVVLVVWRRRRWAVCVCKPLLPPRHTCDTYLNLLAHMHVARRATARWDFMPLGSREWGAWLSGACLWRLSSRWPLWGCNTIPLHLWMSLYVLVSTVSCRVLSRAGHPLFRWRWQKHALSRPNGQTNWQLHRKFFKWKFV